MDKSHREVLTDCPEVSYATFMSLPMFQFSTVNGQGRVVVPAAVRSVLHIQTGDKVEFVVEGDTVRLIPAHARIERVWAANTRHDHKDAAVTVRQYRTEDQQTDELSVQRVLTREDPPGVDETGAELLGALGIQ